MGKKLAGAKDGDARNKLISSELAAGGREILDPRTGKKMSSKETTQTYFELLNNMMSKYSGKQYTDKSGASHNIESSVESINNLFNKNKKQLDIEGNVVLNDAGRPILTKGKYKDQILSDVLLKDNDYYEWILSASTFPSDTKLVIKKIVEKAKTVALTK